MNLGKGSNNSITQSKIVLTILVFISLSIVGGGGWFIYSLIATQIEKGFIEQPEVLMGIVVVTALATLMTVLFILAAGFSYMNLTDPKQPLGLPEGSIRAMIALVLILVFIIFGIYLFRVVGSGYYIAIAQDLSDEDLKNFDMAKYSDKTVSIEKRGDKYTLWLQTKTSDDGARLAQQLLTTVGTLVVAVAGFYFGSTTVSSAVASVQETNISREPTIKEISPNEGKQGDTLNLEISGTDFKSPKAVTLIQGEETMSGTDILSSLTMIHCKLSIDKAASDKRWDVVVENEDGKQGRLPGAFIIK